MKVKSLLEVMFMSEKEEERTDTTEHNSAFWLDLSTEFLTGRHVGGQVRSANSENWKWKVYNNIVSRAVSKTDFQKLIFNSRNWNWEAWNNNGIRTVFETGRQKSKLYSRNTNWNSRSGTKGVGQMYKQSTIQNWTAGTETGTERLRATG
jgi:hypothetical protein